MAPIIPILVPRENVNDESVTVLSLLVADGSRVEEGQPIAEIETSKTSFEMPSPGSGIVRFFCREEEDVAVGGEIGAIGEDEESLEAYSNNRRATPAMVPGFDKSDRSDLSNKSDKSDRSDQSDKSDHPGASQVADSWRKRDESDSPETRPAAGPARFTPKALALLQEAGLSPDVFEGRGLVRSRDVALFLGRPDSVSEAPPASSGATAPGSASTGSAIAATGVPVHEAALTRAKRLEIRTLRASASHVLPSLVSVACPTRGLRAAAQQQGIHAGAVLIHEAARLLRQFPEFNGYYLDGRLQHYDEVNVGFAIDADLGLKVPVVHRADTKPMAEIAAELHDLTVSYLNNDLPLESLSGATFTLSDLSGDGVAAFQPLINQGQSAILGVGAEIFPPESRNGTFSLILAFDHQVAAGRQAARFLTTLADRLGAYERALSARRNAADEANTVFCSHCDRSLADIRRLKGHLLVGVAPDGSQGWVCSLCLRGF